ncbi:metal ABC transporter permease [Streptomyces olindensis]|uniref:Metal ABC transporter permease n=1 Tax=Streptomyces olindensis TaxID=358823 RepID=A0ABV2XQ18_9ACTN
MTHGNCPSCSGRSASPQSSAWCASLIGCAGSVASLYVSYTYDLAAGGSVVVVLTALFALTWCLAPRHGLLAKLVRRPDPAAPLPAGP